METPGTTENIHAYLSGQLTVEQVEAFEIWLNASEQNATQVDELRDVWEIALLYNANGKNAMPEFDSKSAISKMPFGNVEAATYKLEKKTSSRSWRRWAAAAALVLAVGTWAIFQLNGPEMTHLNGQTANYISLDDGTEVFLEKNGAFSFPEPFAKSERLVLLDGEAYFDVARESERQFIIETDFAKVVVLGTEFGVIEDDDSQTVEVIVREGKVRLQPEGSDLYIDVIAGESAIYDHKTGKLQRTKQANMNDIAWHTKRLQFSKTPVSQVISRIEETYNVSIDYNNSEISDCTFSSLYNKVEVTKILEDLSLVFGCRITSPNENHYILNGGNCTPTKDK